MNYPLVINSYGVIEPQPLDPSIRFGNANGTSLADRDMTDYWTWAFSDLVSNTDRGNLAEYIVAMAVGAAGPEKWKPVVQSYWCEYATLWVEIKVRWDLSATNAEWKSLQDMFGTCGTPPSVTTVVVMNQLPIATASPALPVGSASGFGEIRISNIECSGKPEIVVIENSGMATQDMTGWTIEDEGAKYTYRFDSGFLLKPGMKVELMSGGSGEDTDRAIYWNGRAVWNNDGDTASLFNQAGELISKMECS